MCMQMPFDTRLTEEEKYLKRKGWKLDGRKTGWQNKKLSLAVYALRYALIIQKEEDRLKSHHV